MENMDELLNVTVSYRGSSYPIAISATSTISDLRSRIEESTSVPPQQQKLLFKRSKGLSDDTTLTDAGILDGTKIQVLGSTTEEIGKMHQVEDEKHRRERIMRERTQKAPVKVRNTTAPSSSSDLSYRFHRIEPLAHLPDPISARSLLTRLSDDPAVQHVMRMHRFAVGLLTELAPHEHPNLLGLNVNKGEAIKLRIRTDRYDGFRTYKEVRRVLCHELTHNVWGDHDNNFKELNSQLNREIVEFDLDASRGTHHLGGETYEPMDGLDAGQRSHVLGGRSSTASASALSDTREEMRSRVLDAAVVRLRKEEEELEQSCGTAGPAAGSTASS